MLEKISRWLSGQEPEERTSLPKLKLVESKAKPQVATTNAANWPIIEGEWNAGINARSAVPETCRTHIWDRLSLARNQAESAPDRMFLGALLQQVSSEDMALPHFPDTSVQLDRLLTHTDPDYKAIMRIIESDPQLVGQIWTIGRSARFPCPPSSLDMAVSRVGMVEVWRLSLQAVVESIAVESGQYSTAADRVRIHGVLVGDVTAALAKERRGPHFIAGLLHDVGQLVILAAASRTNPDPVLVERVMREQHANLGVLVVHAWRLESVIAEAVAWHHDVSVADEAALELTQCLRIADIAVHGAIDQRMKLQSHPELAIKQASRRPTDPSRPLILASRSIERLERDGIQVIPRQL